MLYRCGILPAHTTPSVVANHLNAASQAGWEFVAMSFVPATPSGDVVLYVFRQSGPPAPGFGSWGFQDSY